jgi:hypothetical protein
VLIPQHQRSKHKVASETGSQQPSQKLIFVLRLIQNEYIIDLKTNLEIYVAKAFADKSYAVPDDSYIFNLTASAENGPQFILLDS